MAWAAKKAKKRLPAALGMLLTLAWVAFGQPLALVLYAQAMGVWLNT